MMKRVASAVGLIASLAAFALGTGALAIAPSAFAADDRVPSARIRDHIRQRMEMRRLERVPQLSSAAKIPSAGPGAESVLIQGQLRTFQRYTPNSVLVRGKRAPVVIALHGASGTADHLQGYLGLNAVADREGFVAVYPQGENNRWNDGREPKNKADGETSTADDVTFLNTLADALVVQGVADPKRIYVLGLSNGGFMALSLACSDGARFAAFGAVIASMPVATASTCKPQATAPVVMINGTEDQLVRFDGKRGQLGISGNLPPLEAARVFADRASCQTATNVALPDADPADGTTVSKTTWERCAPGAGVEFYAVLGGGHQSPTTSSAGRTVVLDSLLGARSRDIDTAETVWAFFKRFSR